MVQCSTFHDLTQLCTYSNYFYFTTTDLEYVAYSLPVLQGHLSQRIVHIFKIQTFPMPMELKQLFLLLSVNVQQVIIDLKYVRTMHSFSCLHIIFRSWCSPACEAINSWPEKICKWMQTTEAVFPTHYWLFQSIKTF